MEKFSEKIKKFFSSEASLQRLPLYFFFTCVLLVVLIFKLGETNHYLKEIAANGTDVIQIKTKDEDYEKVADVYIESTKSAEDIVPLLEEITTEESVTEQSAKESTTKKTESTTKQSQTSQTTQTTADNQNNSSKTTYVLNINSKKIHLEDCSFVSRTKEENKKTVELTDEELQQYLNDGYTLCKTCGGD